MAIKKHTMQITTAITAALRGLTFASGLIALAAAPVARADSATTAPNASVSPATVAAEQTPETTISREYLIKSAILYNFAKFAAWPQTAFGNPGASLRVCVLGDDPFGAALDALNGKQVRNRPLATARISALEEATQCHILFVSTSEKARLAKILDHVGKLPILTVADFGRFANSGGIIALKAVDNRSRIEVNIGAADQAGVKLSSKLLRLADNTGKAVLEANPVAPVGARGAI